MTNSEFAKIENYMLDCMRDSAHDSHHIYRVLYAALDIAAREERVNYDILIAACLLHDVGRLDETRGTNVDHAVAGAARAYAFLKGAGYDEEYCAAVRDCVAAHRYRTSAPPSTTEAKILFDSDKLDVTGMLGVARTLMYGAMHAQSLYALDAEGNVSRGEGDPEETFFREYKFKLEGIYGKFYTARGRELAQARSEAARYAYESLYREASFPYEAGRPLLKGLLGD